VLPLGTTVRLYGNTDKAVRGYPRYYVHHFRGFRWRRNRVLEIGVGGYASAAPSGSLRIWRDYLPRSTIVGIDIHDKDVRLGKRVHFCRGDQTSREVFDRALEALGGAPDIVIDDGSHLDAHAIASFRSS